VLPLFAATIFLAAALLFLVEPMAAKLILPLLGGTPSVWNTCMVFFQAALLAGYLGAHLVGKLRPRAQAAIYSLALALPILVSLLLHRLIITTPDPSPPTSGSPIPWLLLALASMVGAPFLLLSAAAPLLQRWFSSTSHPSAKDPYFLYAASNAGSMLGLLGYPLFIEPTLTLTAQRQAWSIAFGALAILISACGALALRNISAVTSKLSPLSQPKPVPANSPAPSPTARTRLLWLLLAFIPSSLTLGVTQHFSTDIASVPLLWVIPLAIYLLTFIVAFSRRPVPIAPIGLTLALIILAIAICSLLSDQGPIALLIPLHLASLTLAGLLCHSRLAASRPNPSHLTEFYLLIALGGVLGGVFNSLLAPVLFNTIAEYPIALTLALLMRPARPARTPWLRPALACAAPILIISAFASLNALAIHLALDQFRTRALVFGIPVALCLPFIRLPGAFALAAGALFAIATHNAQTLQGGLFRARTFFGVYRVYENGPFNVLIHGTTTHGFQSRDPATSGLPLGYYHRDGPIGQFFQQLGTDAVFDRVALVGLGAGTLAAYGRPGQEMVFHEIDPLDDAIAREPRFFTYIRYSKAADSTVIGDGRLTLARVPDASYGLILLDAFSSDAIPIHLITRDAVALYLTKLRPRGLLAFHISNRFLDLAPVLARIGDDLHLLVIAQQESFDAATTAALFAQEGRAASCWVLMARNLSDLGPLARDPRWPQPPVDREKPAWTDDYSNILSVFRWN
jgi:hypothetical protein